MAYILFVRINEFYKAILNQGNIMTQIFKPILILISIVLLNNTIYAQQEFFLNDWEPKSITSPTEFIEGEASTNQSIVNVILNFADTLSKVSKYNFGNNANTYSTKMWNNLELVSNLKNLNPHVIRYPGGNLSNEFFWDREPGNKPTDIPQDIGVWYGRDEGDWTMSVDNYYKFLDVINSTGIICVNYGYARYGTSEDPVAQAAHYAAEWVRYDNGRTKYWEIGNENFGNWQAGYEIDQSLNKDGQPQFISGDLYGAHALIFVDSMKAAAAEIEHEIFIGFQAWEEESSWDPIQAEWNETMMPVVGETPDFYIVHNYYTPYDENSNAQTILDTYEKAGDFRESVIADLTEAGLSEKPITLTEFNIFAVGSQQQVSHINGLHGVLVVGNVIKEKYGLTARWNLANGWGNGDDHGMFSKGEPEVSNFTPYPVFYHLTFFQRYFGDSMMKTFSTDANIVLYSSLFSSGQAGVAIINKGHVPKSVEFLISNYNLGERYYWYQLKDENSDGSFSPKVFINGEGPSQVSGGPANYNSIKPYSRLYDGNVKIDVPPYSAIYMLLDSETSVGIKEDNVANNRYDFQLEQNYPNPFNPSTEINYQIARASRVELNVFNALGQKVDELVNKYQGAGKYSVNFEAQNLPSGIYFYTIKADGKVDTKKMILLK